MKYNYICASTGSTNGLLRNLDFVKFIRLD